MYFHIDYSFCPVVSGDSHSVSRLPWGGSTCCVASSTFYKKTFVSTWDFHLYKFYLVTYSKEDTLPQNSM